MSEESGDRSLDFIREIIEEDIRLDKHKDGIHTRFPPEPNGYLHIGHAKAICVDFGVAEEYDGKCNQRFDDTNPVKEDVEYVDSIMEDIRWLGFDWEDRLYFASDYFGRMYDLAEQLISQGDAYVCDLSAEEVREYRGTLRKPGRNSPYRRRSIEENLDLFRRMRAGEFPDGSRTLRAMIDMASPNINMRDPAIYRILRKSHHRTGDEWCIYPMYDYAHCLEDSIEGITHSLCSIEFEDHRPLYDWFLERLGIFHPRQIEFARLNLGYTLMSKRKLGILVEDGLVNGWDDPRMPTLSGLRRRGVPPEAIRAFIERIGLAKRNSMVDMALFEDTVRKHLNCKAIRYMGVLDPLKVTIENYPEGLTEEMEFISNPEDESAGTRMVPFSRELYIERDDFQIEPHRKFKRLAPGREVRLRYAYLVTCTEVITDDDGNVIEIICIYDPDTRGGNAPDGRKVRGTIHWVSAGHAVPAEIRLYDRLFSVENPLAEENFESCMNPDSMVILNGCMVEPEAAAIATGITIQFERKGYFCKDTEAGGDALTFNRTIALRDTWAKMQDRQAAVRRK